MGTMGQPLGEHGGMLGVLLKIARQRSVKHHYWSAMEPQPSTFLSISDFDALETDLVRDLAKVLPTREGQLHTDLSILSIVVGTLAGMLGSYMVNNIPTWKDRRGRFNREQIAQIEEELRHAVYSCQILAKRDILIPEIETLLPPQIEDRHAYAERMVDRILAQLKPKLQA